MNYSNRERELERDLQRIKEKNYIMSWILAFALFLITILCITATLYVFKVYN